MGEERQEEEVATLASYKCSSSMGVVTVGDARWIVSRYAQNPTKKRLPAGGTGASTAEERRSAVEAAAARDRTFGDLQGVCQLGGNI